MLNIAMIGCGYIGESHISAYSAMDPQAVKLTAIVDANREKGLEAAQRAGCEWFATLDDAVSAVSVDVVDVCVPTFLHERFVLEAARLGKHVLCEKPATLSLESFDRMAQACEVAGVRFMTGQVVRFIPEFVKIREIVRSGKLGKLHMVSEQRLSQHPAWTTWHRDPEKSGGGLFDLNTHDIDYLYSLFGLPEEISAVGWKSDTGCWNHVVTTMRWSTHQAVCETSLEMTGDYPFTVGVRIVGDGGSLEYRFSAGANIREEEGSSRFFFCPVGAPCENIEVETRDWFLAELTDFLQAVAEDREVPIPPRQTRDVLRILLATKESLETGKPVRL